MTARRYYSAKTYTHSVGLSVAFRQWKADSHCKYLHGYALEVRLEFAAAELNDKSWVVDFGSLKPVKAWLEKTFDHKTLITRDDPALEWFEEAHKRGIIDLLTVEKTSSEGFAEMIFDHVLQWLVSEKLSPRVRLYRVEVKEHAGNSAIVEAV